MMDPVNPDKAWWLVFLIFVGIASFAVGYYKAKYFDRRRRK